MNEISFFSKSNVDRLPILKARLNFQKGGQNVAVLEAGRRLVNYHLTRDVRPILNELRYFIHVYKHARG